MLEYLQKFNNLPKDIRDKVSNKQAMAVIETLELKYGVELASLVMQIMIKDLSLSEAAARINQEFHIPLDRANSLVNELKARLLADLGDYLGFKNETVDSKPVEPMLAPPKSVIEAGKSLDDSKKFFFYAEDEEDIKQLTEKAQELQKMNVDSQTDLIIENIMREADVNFGSQILKDRFSKIIKTNLRGVRDVIETKLALMKRFEDGGLGFDSEASAGIMQIIQKHKQGKVVGGESFVASKSVLDKHLEKHELGMQSEEKTKTENKFNAIAMRDMPYDLKELVKKKEKEKAPATAKEEVKETESKLDLDLHLDFDHELEPPPPAIIKKTPFPKKIETVKTVVRQVPSQETLKPQKTNKKPNKVFTKLEKPKFAKDNFEKSRIVFREGAVTGGKTKMEDIKRVPRTMDPIDELRYMDIIIFNRMSDNPMVTIDKIRSKIALLTEDSYAKRSEAIRAWRESPVNKIYTAILSDSIRSGKPIDAIINKRKKQGEDILTPQQFEAIMSLNGELKW